MYEPLYKNLYRIRRVEEQIARIYPTDKLKSPVHLSIGQEAVAAAMCAPLTREDTVFCTYRSHAAYLAKGGDLKRMLAEMYGKATGCTKGKGGGMHLIDPEVGVMGASAVVGTTIANAVGYAYSVKLRRKNTVVMSFFGDGGSEEGVFAESLNFAVLKKLPVIFVCENNGYAIHTHQSKRQGLPDICGRAKAAGVTSELITGNDILKMHERAIATVDELRNGTATGPFFFECQTYRWKEHVGPNEDFKLGYRTQEQARAWIDNDQVKRLAALLPARRRKEIETEIDAEIEEAIAFAEESPFPDLAELMTDVFHTSSPSTTGDTASLLPAQESTDGQAAGATRRGRKTLTTQKAA
ncbi:MAG TPA: thiamine pyrophosphate-dependent dehydrogenase E1 component subunit alpha [Planctomycetaceae bacterium]|jgi:TPP-dependent pyruvate/acetoin dehydrogenase alpha subunit|nr:thiamine pyrophosphate-dependent dehydrogenase E1 component subunit alpha [Planctomycetaceae bacterium]